MALEPIKTSRTEACRHIRTHPTKYDHLHEPRKMLEELSAISHAQPPSQSLYIPFSHKIGSDRQQIYAGNFRQDNNMRACVIQPKSNHTPLHRNARTEPSLSQPFHLATPPRLASIGQVRRSLRIFLLKG